MMSVVPVDAAAVYEVVLDVLSGHFHDLGLVAHDPNGLHA